VVVGVLAVGALVFVAALATAASVGVRVGML
jgi:hypothetical protein